MLMFFTIAFRSDPKQGKNTVSVLCSFSEVFEGANQRAIVSTYSSSKLGFTLGNKRF